MKLFKVLTLALVAVALATARADVTNYVYTVSNIYIRTSEVRYITNRVQNTHYNYYFTNNVSTVTNVFTVNHVTNYNYNVVNTNFGPWITSASNQANRASSGAAAATNMANVAAGHATTAGSYSSSAQNYAALAQSYKNQAQSIVNDGLSSVNQRVSQFEGTASGWENTIQSRVRSGLDEINSRIDYFDMYAGKMVTNVYLSGMTVTNINMNVSMTTNVNVSLTTNLTYTTVTNVAMNYTTVTNVVMDYSSATNVNVTVTTNLYFYTMTNTTVNFSLVTNLNYSTVVSNTYILPGTGGGSIDLQTLSMPYTTTNGTEYANIQYYPLGHVNGKVCATPGTGHTAAQSILFAPNLQGASTFTDKAFEFRLSHVDSDEGGMRIHYVGRANQRLIWSYASGMDFVIVPRDFYWQGGHYYARVDALYWSDSNSSYGFVGRFTYRAASASFPDSVNATISDSTASAYQSMDVISYQGSQNLRYNTSGYYKTQQGGALPAGSPLWVPASPSPEQSEVIEWTNTTFPVYY
jgi:hypothetical protein